MRVARPLLLAAAVALWAAFLWPSWGTTQHPGRTVRWVTVGLPASPWASYTRYEPGGPEAARTGVESRGGWEWEVTLSWSWAFVVLACGALHLRGRAGRASSTPPQALQ